LRRCDVGLRLSKWVPNGTEWRPNWHGGNQQLVQSAAKAAWTGLSRRSGRERYGAREAVATSTTVQACWEKVGFTYQRRDGTFYLGVHEGKIRIASDFQEIWERDYPIGSRSARRRS
jgi:hypothetical protein